MFFVIFFTVILVIFQSFLILSTKINLYPELIIFPYLVKIGCLPYQDFFDHHGFLIYYVLSLFLFDKNLLSFKLVFFLIQSLNLILFLIILKKTVPQKKFFITFGFLFVILNYFFADQTLWYENFILFFYLVIFLLSFYYKKYKKNGIFNRSSCCFIFLY